MKLLELSKHYFFFKHPRADRVVRYRYIACASMQCLLLNDRPHAYWVSRLECLSLPRKCGLLKLSIEISHYCLLILWSTFRLQQYFLFNSPIYCLYVIKTFDWVMKPRFKHTVNSIMNTHPYDNQIFHKL